LERRAEEQIVQAARRGDMAAFGTLYERHYATMVWVAYSILLDRDQAEDVAQQAFVKACEKLGGLRRVDRFSPWLARICRNEAHQWIRQRRRSMPLCRSETAVVGDSEPDGPDIGVVKAAINQLAPMYREIVILFYYNRMDYRQIASTLGVALNTVRGRLFRARRQIERTLRKSGYPEG